jgi:hypothetical protein
MKATKIINKEIKKKEEEYQKLKERKNIIE